MVRGRKSLAVCLISLLCVSAFPTPITETSDGLAISQTAASATLAEVRRDNAAKSPALRILSLGASIVWGQYSTDGNGFRGPLRYWLREDGFQVNMIGSISSGTMADNQVDGYPGATISEIHSKPGVDASLKQKPNVVLVLAGTNDAVRRQNEAPTTVATDMVNDMKKFINTILQQSPAAVVILSTLPPNANGKVNNIIQAYNSNIDMAIQKLENEGKYVGLVDSYSSLTLQDLADGTHPTDAGYDTIAEVFYSGIHAATSLGYITQPSNVNPSVPLSGPD